MEARAAEAGDVAWFRLTHPVVDGAGPLSSLLGPADWTHGITRPLQDVVADPNPNLTVQLFRPPQGEWIGIRAQTRWRPATGFGVGSGTTGPRLRARSRRAPQLRLREPDPGPGIACFGRTKLEAVAALIKAQRRARRLAVLAPFAKRDYGVAVEDEP